MSKIDIIEQLITQSSEISLNEVLFSLLLSITLCYILKIIYVKYGKALSNRRRFSNNFILLGATTTIIISIIKSSLALSLGLVGSLSIIRFRTAIKDPEELAFLFMIIAIGLGIGANKWWVTTISFGIISLVIIIRGITGNNEKNESFHLIISGKSSRRLTLRNLTRIIDRHSKSIILKRFDQTDSMIEATFALDLKSFERLEKLKDELNNLSNSINITYLDLNI